MAIMAIVGVIAVHVLVILVVMIYEICSIPQARDRARSASVNPMIDYDAPQHDVPSSEPFPTRRRLQLLTLQIALPNHEVDEFEYLSYGELSSTNIFRIPSMNDGEINALPTHNCNCTGLERNCYVTFAWSQLWRVTVFVAFHYVFIRFMLRALINGAR